MSVEICPERFAAYSIRLSGQGPSIVENRKARDVVLAYRSNVKDACPRLGECAVTWCHETIENADSPRVLEEYILDCVADCPLQIGHDLKV